MITANVTLYKSNEAENKTEDQPKAPVISIRQSGAWGCLERGNVFAYEIIRCNGGFERKNG